MASGGATISHGGGLAGRYAAALYSLAEDDRVLDDTVWQMQGLAQLIDTTPDFRRLLDSPLIDIKQGMEATQAVLTNQGFSPLVIRFRGCGGGQPPSAPIACHRLCLRRPGGGEARRGDGAGGDGTQTE